MNTPATEPAQTTTNESQRFRSQVGHISRQSGVFFAGMVFTSVLGYAFKIYLARVLGAKDLGLYALGMTLVGFFGIFNTLGLPQSALRFVASYSAAQKLRELHALLWRGGLWLIVANVVFGAVLMTLGRVIAVKVYHSPALVQYLPLFALTMLVSVVGGFYGKVLAGYRDIKVRTWILSFVGSPLNILVTVGLITAGFGLRGYLLAQIVSAAVVCGLLLLAVRRFTPLGARFSQRPGANPEKEVWTFSTAMLGLAFLEFLVSHVDKVALGYFRTAREVGVYSIASALVAYVPLVLSSINQIFAPMIADLHTRNEMALLGRLFQSLTKWSIGLTLPPAMVVMIFARPLMGIFGPDFEAGWPILVIGTLGQLVNCGVGSVGYLLVMSGHEKRLIKVQTAMAAVMVLASVCLVPWIGIVGAAVAAALTNAGVNLWNLFEVRRSLRLSPYNRSYIRLLLPTVVALGSALALRRYPLVFHHNWIAIGVALMVAYAVFTFVLLAMGLDDDDRLIASAIWSRVRTFFGRAGVPA